MMQPLRDEPNLPTFSSWRWISILLSLLMIIGTPALSAPKPQLVSRGQRFELTLTSEASYANPVLDVVVKARFISPAGVPYEVYGFWDGDDQWKVRLRPNSPGRWAYEITASNSSNPGLNHLRGEFECVASAGKTVFERRGELRVAGDGTRFEHTDGTPFLLLIDPERDAMRQTPPPEWRARLAHRAAHQVNGMLVGFWPGTDAAGEHAFRSAAKLDLNLACLREWESRVTQLNQRGMVALIAPLWGIGALPPNRLPEASVVAFWRQVLGRWNSHEVLWVFAEEGDGTGVSLGRARRLGREIFGGISTAPVIVFPGSTVWWFDELREESWVSALGYQVTDAFSPDALRWLQMGPTSVEWQKSPVRPVLNLSPGDHPHLSWWGLLLSPPVGTTGTARTLWRVAECAREVEFRSLQPAPRIVANQPGMADPKRFIAAAQSRDRQRTLVYAPEATEVDLHTAHLPIGGQAFWCSTTGRGRQTALATLLPTGVTRFTAPGVGNWVLMVEGERR